MSERQHRVSPDDLKRKLHEDFDHSLPEDEIEDAAHEAAHHFEDARLDSFLPTLADKRAHDHVRERLKNEQLDAPEYSTAQGPLASVDGFVLFVAKAGVHVGRVHIVELEDERWVVDFDDDFPAEDMLAIQDVFDECGAFDLGMGLTGSHGPNAITATAGEQQSARRFMDELAFHGYSVVRYEANNDRQDGS